MKAQNISKYLFFFLDRRYLKIQIQFTYSEATQYIQMHFYTVRLKIVELLLLQIISYNHSKKNSCSISEEFSRPRLIEIRKFENIEVRLYEYHSYII